MAIHRSVVLMCATALAAAAGCAQVDATQSAAEAAPRKPVYREHGSLETAPKQPGSREPSAAPAPDLMSRMSQDLAQRLGVRASALQVLAIEQQVWNDGSLGCRQPGQSYTMAQVPGLSVLFQHAAKTYQYHAAESGQFVYCENPSKPMHDVQ